MSSIAATPASVALPRLPPELTDYTVDFLHDDVPTLRALALASRSTLPSARYHLFNSITLHSITERDRALALVTSCPHLSSYIQSLTFSKTTNGTHLPTNTSTAWEATIASTILPHSLTSLKTLHLDHFLSFWQPASFSILSYEAFKSVRVLRISNSSLRSFTELRLLLIALPDVESLVLEDVGIGMKAEDVAWMLAAASFGNEKDEVQRQQIIDGTQTPPALRQHAQSLLKDPVALTSLRIVNHPVETSSPTLSLDALRVLLSYLLSTPSIFSLKMDQVQVTGFESLGEDAASVVKSFRDALVKARKDKEWTWQ